MREYDNLLEEVLSTPFIKLDIDIDGGNLLNEYKSIEEKYSFERYNTKFWPVRKKYARSWSGICLVSSDGGLYTDMYEGRTAAAKETELKDSVFGKKDGEYGLSYNDLIAPMIKAIQELKAEVDKLKQECKCK